MEVAATEAAKEVILEVAVAEIPKDAAAGVPVDAAADMLEFATQVVGEGTKELVPKVPAEVPANVLEDVPGVPELAAGASPEIPKEVLAAVAAAQARPVHSSMSAAAASSSTAPESPEKLGNTPCAGLVHARGRGGHCISWTALVLHGDSADMPLRLAAKAPPGLS